MRQICISAALVFCTLSFGTLSCCAQMESGEMIKIGVSGPFTGGSAAMGESMRNGIRLAAEEINGIGGINGKKIELIERDDQAKPELGATIAQEFTQQKVNAVIGIVNTGVGAASIDAYQKAKIPLMIAVSTGTMLTKKYAPPAAAENYIFRIAPTMDLEVKVLIADLKRRDVEGISILADATAYGDAGLKALKLESVRGGLKIVSEGRFNIGDRDMTVQVRAAKSSGAQALVVWGIGPELAVIAKNKMNVGWDAPMLGSWTFSMRDFIESAGKAGEGTFMPQTFIQNPDSYTKTSFLLMYKRAFNTDLIPSPMSAAQGYDGMHLLYLAILQANSTDGAEIKKAFENLKSGYQGVVTSYRKPFSKEDHEAITQNMLFIGKISRDSVDYAYESDRKRSALLRLKEK